MCHRHTWLSNGVVSMITGARLALVSPLVQVWLTT